MDLENVILIFAYDFAMEVRFFNIFMYLHNKNSLEYTKIARSGPKSMFPNIEGRSTTYYVSSRVDLFSKIHFKIIVIHLNIKRPLPKTPKNHQ